MIRISDTLDFILNDYLAKHRLIDCKIRPKTVHAVVGEHSRTKSPSRGDLFEKMDYIYFFSASSRLRVRKSDSTLFLLLNNFCYLCLFLFHLHLSGRPVAIEDFLL